MKTLLIPLLSISFSLALSPLAPAQLADTNRWKVNLGVEFPGATASAEAGTDDGSEYVGLEYDFSGGGNYVALVNDSPIQEPSLELRFQVYLDAPHNLAARFVDARGEVFQYTVDTVTPGEWSDQRIKLSEAPTTRFMASGQSAGDGKIIYPISSVWLIIENNPKEAPQGNVKFRKIEVK